MNNLNVIDVSALVYTGTASKFFADKSNFGYPVGGIHYFMRQLCCTFLDMDSAVLCFDSPSFRSGLLSEYKSGRVKSPAVYSQIEFLYESLMQCGLQCEKYDEYEADDLVSWAVAQNKDNFSEIVIIGNDHDLCHNVQPGVRFKSIARDCGFIYEGNFEDSVDSSHTKFNTISAKKALTGCKSDKIPGMVLEDGRTGAEVYSQFCKFLDSKGCYDWPNTSSWKLLWVWASRVGGFSSADLEILRRQMNLAFPSDCPEGVRLLPIAQPDIVPERMARFLTMINDYDSLKSLGLRRITLTEDDKQLLRSKAKGLASGEFAADRNLEMSNSIQCQDLDFFTKEF